MPALHRVVVALVLMLLAGTQTGCMTGALWHDAKTEELTGPILLAGRDLDGPKPHYDLVYRLPGTWWGPTDYLFIVPAESTADYTLPPQWPDRVTTVPTEADARPTAPLAAKPLPPQWFVRRLESPRVSAASPDAKQVVLHRDVDERRSTAAVFVLPSTGGSPTGKTVHLQDGSDVVVTDQTRFMLFPGKQPRPAGDRSGAMVRAALLTPLTLLADIVVTPVIFFGHL